LELNVIDEHESSKIINIIEDNLGKSLYAAVLYGSRISGYAREDSDYDAIGIVKDLGYPLRYLYVEYPDKNVYISALLANKKVFEKDSEFADYGEFIIGRLLSPYIAIRNKDYIEKYEICYKKRVILEELMSLYNKYKDLTLDFIIPLKYILLSRLKRRIQTYPIVKYSYVKTYYGKCGFQNMKWAVNRFKIAATELSKEAPIEIIDENCIVLKSGIRGFDKLDTIMWIRGLKSYIAHGLSARVKPRVVGEEVKSKVMRSIEMIRSPIELENPEILLRTKFSLFTPKPLSYKDIVRTIFGSEVRIKTQIKKGLLSPTYILEVDSLDNKNKIVIKEFSWLWIIKWLLIQLWTIDVKKFSISPRSRMLNEYLGLINIKEISNVNSPKPLLIDWGGKKLVIEYVVGDRLSEYIDKGYSDFLKKKFYEYGVFLGNIHSQGYTIGDTKPQNILIGKQVEQFTIIDLEQWRVDQNKSWDISLFLFYSFKFKIKYQKMKDIIKAFIKGYRDGGGNIKDLKKAVSIRFIRPFIFLTPLNTLLKIRSIILESTIKNQSVR